MSRLFDFASDEYYHLYNRGTEKRNVFSNPSDYRRFHLLLHLANSVAPVRIRDRKSGQGLTSAKTILSQFAEEISERLVHVGAYCLMPNHFHMLVREIEPGNLSIFMQKLTTAYTMYFNKKYERVGALFQGTFKAKHVEDDGYLKYLFAYIHLNPIKLINPDWQKTDRQIDPQKIFFYLDAYEYSSFTDYAKTGHRPAVAIINPEAFPKYFSSVIEHREELLDWFALGKV